MPGVFCVSLDAEFFWGVHDFTTEDLYGRNIIGARNCAIPEMLKLFQKYGIHATWAFVGGACAETVNELKCFMPPIDQQPTYQKEFLSPYRLVDQMQEDLEQPSVFLAGKELKRVGQCPDQEIGTHTFSHYFCLEPGQTPEQFAADLRSAMRIAESKKIAIKSIVFPKNQISKDYLRIASQLGITSYRGIEKNWIYNSKLPDLLKRILRFADAYFPISGHNCHLPEYEEGICNIRGSRIFKPYLKKLSILEPLKVIRIKGQLRYAAKHNRVFHLWWHPHNFGINTANNLKNLEEVLQYYEEMHSKYGMECLNMSEIQSRCKEVTDRG